MKKAIPRRSLLRFKALASGRSPTDLLDLFVKGKEPRPDAAECHGPKALKKVMESAWHVEATKRPSAKEKTFEKEVFGERIVIRKSGIGGLVIVFIVFFSFFFFH